MNYTSEKVLTPQSGFPTLIFSILLFLASVGAIILSGIHIANNSASVWSVGVIIIASVYTSVVLPIWLCGLKVVQPNEAAVYTLFGRYYGTITKPGFYLINPFVSMFHGGMGEAGFSTDIEKTKTTWQPKKKVSLKVITLNNPRQKIHDRDGNPIEIGVVVIWRVVNATKAVFEVDDYREYISTQADAAIRNTVRVYPYDIAEEGDEKTLRGSSGAVAEELKADLQKRVELAGIEVLEARISHLAYAQEIASAMLQRQQADALIAAKQKIVEGAVGMVEMALNRLSERDVVALDDERKAAMVSNLLVVLCGGKDAQPIVNSGSIY
jgi:regulator of protease activity HflC (stomatin/prohibitin superfamily)